MSRGQKLVLAGLALFLVLTVLVVGLGGRLPACSGSTAECARAVQVPDWTKSLGGLLAGFSDRVELPRPRYVLPAGTTLRVDIPAGKGLRPLRITLDAGSAHVAYLDREPDALPHAPGAGPADQSGDLPGSAASPEAPRQASFTVSHAGGALVITCRGGVQCVIVQP